MGVKTPMMSSDPPPHPIWVPIIVGFLTHMGGGAASRPHPTCAHPHHKGHPHQRVPGGSRPQN